ncbi:hypothetical protein [uncultured Sphingomonas sp.]|uniref:hypothetical protein n=1 Tax=uncultured Sphingomonas sp. TaxID=158754 RepID=UPI0035CB6525
MAGREDARSGKMLQGVVSGNGIAVYNYDNSYPGSDGASLVLSGSYEGACRP